MKKIYLIIAILISSIIMQAQNIEEYNINVKSKYGTNVQISFFVHFVSSDKPFISKSSISSIEKNVADSVVIYDAMQMYSFKRADINALLNRTIKKYSNNLSPKDNPVVLSEVNFAKEIKILNEHTLNLKMKFIGIELKIEDRKNLLRNQLASAENLTKNEVKEIEKELFILENSKYVERIYKDEVGTIIIK